MAPTPEQLRKSLQELRGEVELRVPAVSAVKIGGERAYRLARRGEAPEMPLRRSRIDELLLLGYSGGVARLDLRVSSGTYVRAIADRLGGHCTSLRRLEVGPFSVSDADSELIQPALEALPFFPLVELSEAETGLVRNGAELARDEEGPLRLCLAGRLIAVARGKNGTVRPEAVMPG